VAKSRGWEIINDQVEATSSLFSPGRLVIYRDWRKLGKREVKNLSRLTSTLVIYHEGIIPVSFIRNLPRETKIERYDLPKFVWKFLDSPTLKGLHEVLENEPAEFVFAILAKRFRDLYWVLTDPKTLSLPDWQQARLKKQASAFTPEKLKAMIGELAEIDLKVKTSKSDLLSALDFFFVSKLK
jgi:DNA polymerase III delta subunit